MQRYAVYYAPREGAFAVRVNEWLGRAPGNHHDLPQAVLPGVGDPRNMTAEPRRYGFHGTIRAPFRPAEGVDEDQIRATVMELAARMMPITCDGLRVEILQGFVAFTPTGGEATLLDFGAKVVEGTNHLRAPLTEAEIARRRPDRLSPRQRDLLGLWGYPHVMEEFNFHLTLTDRLDQPEPVRVALEAYFYPVMPRPFVIEDLCLFGEDSSGHFHLLHRCALSD